MVWLFVCKLSFCLFSIFDWNLSQNSNMVHSRVSFCLFARDLFFSNKICDCGFSLFRARLNSHVQSMSLRGFIYLKFYCCPFDIDKIACQLQLAAVKHQIPFCVRYLASNLFSLFITIILFSFAQPDKIKK